MIVGTGTDILQVSRVSAALARTPRLARRILTESEFVDWQQSKQQARFLAKRFAAKEALVKALGTGIGRGVSWQHFEIAKDPAGRPIVIVTAGAEKIAQEMGIRRFHLSYSDEQEYIVAFAIAEG